MNPLDYDLNVMLYEKNKYVDRYTYEENKQKAIERANGNQLQNDLAWKFDLGNMVGSADYITAKVIADWYEGHSYEWIQRHRKIEEQGERTRQYHEKQMRTSPEYRAQKDKERLEAEERARERQKAASKRKIWSIICGLLSGIIGLFVFGYIVYGLVPEHPVIFVLIAGFTFVGLVRGLGGGDTLCACAGWVLGPGALLLCYLLKDYDVHYYASETVLGVVVGILTGVAVGRWTYTSKK